MKDLDALEPWARSILKSLDAKSRQNLMRQFAKKLKSSNQKRIRNQKNAEGQKWPARKTARKVNDLEITYRDKSGTVTRRRVRSVIGSKTHLHGHDYLRGAFRSFRRKGILEVHSSKIVRRKSEQKMLTGFAKRLRTKAFHDACVVYLSEKDSKIARIHHYGLRQKIGKHNIQYPKRELLGISKEDREELQRIVIEHIAKGD